MFAPEGYAVFADVDELFRLWSREALPYPASGFDQGVKNRRNGLWYALRTEFFRTCPSLSVASPRGQLMHVSRQICAFGFEEQDDPTFKGYVFLDDKTWVVRAKHGRDRIAAAVEAYLDVTTQLEAMRPKWRETPEVEELLWHAALLQPVAQLNMPGLVFLDFEGWALTCRIGDVPSSIADLDVEVEGQSLAEPEEERPSQGPRVGRPRKREDALDAFNRLLPGGRGSRTWKEVAEVLADEGLVVSPDLLRRVIPKGGKNPG